MCKIINTSSSSFYKWISRSKSNRDKKTEELILLVKEAHQDSNHGSPRIALELNKKNYRISRSYVARLMRKLNLRSKIRKQFKVTTDSKHKFKLAENLLAEIFLQTVYLKNGLVILPTSKLDQDGYILLI
ncbi:IS3 family transposase [Pedobacter sp. AW1-32]|uniref:IS3 family transposase n=1 Tax=Pedobacter sp. AW1-32 TaxID=3383026 RepID=UPI003FF0CFAB